MDGQSWAQHKQIDRDIIQAHIDAFLAKGGLIERLGATPVRGPESTRKSVINKDTRVAKERREPANVES